MRHLSLIVLTLLSLTLTACVDGDRAINSLEENNKTLKEIGKSFDERAAAIEKPLAKMTETISKLGAVFEDRTAEFLKTAESLANFVDKLNPQQLEDLGKSLQVLANFISKLNPEDFEKYGPILEKTAVSLNNINDKILLHLDDFKMPMSALVRQFSASMMVISKISSSLGIMSKEDRDLFIDISNDSAATLVKLMGPTLEATQKDVAQLEKLASNIKKSSDDDQLWKQMADKFLNLPDQIEKQMQSMMADAKKMITDLGYDTVPATLSSMSKNLGALSGLIARHQGAMVASTKQLVDMHTYWKKKLEDPALKADVNGKYADALKKYDELFGPNGTITKLMQGMEAMNKNMENLYRAIPGFMK